MGRASLGRAKMGRAARLAISTIEYPTLYFFQSEMVKFIKPKMGSN
jgi:hypothetical protein